MYGLGMPGVRTGLAEAQYWNLPGGEGERVNEHIDFRCDVLRFVFKNIDINQVLIFFKQHDDFSYELLTLLKTSSDFRRHVRAILRT